jgi:hypothetical protein
MYGIPCTVVGDVAKVDRISLEAKDHFSSHDRRVALLGLSPFDPRVPARIGDKMMHNPFSSQRRLMDVRGAADYLRLSASTLNKFRLTGKGPAYLKLGGRVIYDADDLDQ